MNGRLFSFSISGHPVGQFLAMIVMCIVLVGAVFMGAIAFLFLLGLFVIGYSAFSLRAWWRWRMSRNRGPSDGGPAPGPAKGIRYIEGEYEVVEADADADAARRGSGTRDLAMAAPTLPSSMDRRRRRRLRLIPIIGYTIVALGFAYFFTMRASTTVIFVRHADTGAEMPDGDPPLNERGRQRAELLADFLEDIDVVAGVNAIYVERQAPYARDRGAARETPEPHSSRARIISTLTASCTTCCAITTARSCSSCRTRTRSRR